MSRGRLWLLPLDNPQGSTRDADAFDERNERQALARYILLSVFNEE